MERKRWEEGKEFGKRDNPGKGQVRKFKIQDLTPLV